MGFIDAIDEGSWPDWIAALGTSAAFIVAARSYAHSVVDRRQAQARLVYSQVVSNKSVIPGKSVGYFDAGRCGSELFGDAEVEIKPNTTDTTYTVVARTWARVVAIEVINVSNELIGPVIVRVRLAHESTPRKFEARAEYIAPGDKRSMRLYLGLPDHVGLHTSATLTILFRDSSGRWWKRVASDPIEQIHFDPDSFPARARWCAHLPGETPDGVDDSVGSRGPQPKVGLRTRTRRALRRARGLDGVP